jgi:hypothetical protein
MTVMICTGGGARARVYPSVKPVEVTVITEEEDKSEANQPLDMSRLGSDERHGVVTTLELTEALVN